MCHLIYFICISLSLYTILLEIFIKLNFTILLYNLYYTSNLENKWSSNNYYQLTKTKINAFNKVNSYDNLLLSSSKRK